MATGNGALTHSSVSIGDAQPGLKKRQWGFLLIWPAFLYLLAFLIVYPFLYNIYQSLFSYSMLTGTPKFVGFQNFVELFAAPDYLRSLLTSLFILVTALGIETLLGIAIALMLNQNFRGKVLARMLLIL